MTKHVPMAAFKDRVSEFVAEAEAGDEVIITRHGKPAAKLVPVNVERKAMQREAVRKMLEVGNRVRARNGGMSREELRQLLEESRP